MNARPFAAIRRAALRAWSLLRRLTGDDAYERYLEHFRREHAGGRPLARAEFLRQRQEQQWRGVNRCC